jgi:hypothetical protein
MSLGTVFIGYIALNVKARSLWENEQADQKQQQNIIRTCDNQT